MLKTKILPAICILILSVSACTTLTTPTATVAVTSTPTAMEIPLTEDDVTRVTLEDAKAAFDSGTAIFVDVRSWDSYKAGHIPDAVLIQLQEIEAGPAKLKLPKDQWIITYCT
jgi:3-mercaptopyruvate sulfurtransferase SseA